MNILFVSPHFPYPTVTHAGGVYVTRLIEALGRRGHNVSLLSLVTADDSAYIEDTRRICHTLITLRIDPALRNTPTNLLRHLLHPETFQVWHPGLPAALARVVAENRIDIVQFFWGETGQYLEVLKNACPGVMCAIDAIAPTIERTLRSETQLLRRIWLYWYWKHASRYESRTYPKCAHVLTLSEKDRKDIADRVPLADVSVLCPPVDDELLQHSIQLNRSEDILFVGNMGRPPNVEAVLWFYSQVFPLVCKQRPRARLYIVGDSPAVSVKALSADPRVVVTGRVESIADYYRNCRLTVVPLFIGGGIIKKAVDAFAVGCPVVATRIGVEGVGAQNGREALIADSPHEFSAAVVRVLEDDLLWMQLAQAGRTMVRTRFNWNISVTQLERLYEHIASRDNRQPERQ